MIFLRRLCHHAGGWDMGYDVGAGAPKYCQEFYAGCSNDRADLRGWHLGTGGIKLQQTIELNRCVNNRYIIIPSSTPKRSRTG